MPGHEDHRHLFVPFQRRAHQRRAVGAGHADIGDEDAGKLGKQMRQGLGRGCAGEHVDLLQRQRLGRGLAQVGLVIDEKNGAGRGRVGGHSAASPRSAASGSGRSARRRVTVKAAPPSGWFATDIVPSKSRMML
jgi:hypothetical protein